MSLLQVVKLLINKVDVKIKNLEGKTALDIMKEHGIVEDEEVKEMLHGSHSLKDVVNFLCSILFFVFNNVYYGPS